MESEEEIIQIQKRIMKKINSFRYCYTTLSGHDTTNILLGLALNWIGWEMEKEKLKGKETP